MRSAGLCAVPLALPRCLKTSLTASEVNHTLWSESSDGLASVGTASHRKEVALLPGGLFVCGKHYNCVRSVSLTRARLNRLGTPLSLIGAARKVRKRTSIEHLQQCRHRAATWARASRIFHGLPVWQFVERKRGRAAQGPSTILWSSPMHEVIVSMSCLLIVLAPCAAVLASRVEGGR